jgi:hypothetical protein
MNGSPSTKMTVLYVAKTGHIVAAVGRTDGSSSSPAVADLVGDGLRLRGAPNIPRATSPALVGTFILPQGDLTSQDVPFDQVGPYPWGRAINLAAGSGPSAAGQPVVLSNLTPYPTATPPTLPTPASGSPWAVSITGPPAGSPYYLVVAQPATMGGAPATASGTLGPSGTTTIPLSLLNLPTMTSGTVYPVLVLVQTMLPYVATLTLP